MKWLRRDPWRDAFQDLLECHLGPACDQADVDIDDLASLIGADMAATLWGCAFEDFLTREIGDVGNIVDDYLKRRGWNEKAADKAYMTGLRSSVMSLYEVSDVKVGKSLLAQDLIRGGEAVRVSEGTATQSLKQWDRVAARLVEAQGKVVFGGGLLYFDHDLADTALTTLHHAGKPAANEGREMLLGSDRNSGPADLNQAFSDTEVLRQVAPLITTIWLSDALDQVLNPRLPEISNSDGDEIVFMTLHYKLRPGVTVARVRKALDRVSNLQAESKNFWNWLELTDEPAKYLQTKGRSGLAFVSALDDGSLCLGSLELKGKRLLLTVNSEARADRAHRMLAPALDGLVDEPLVERQDLAQAMADEEVEIAAGDSFDIPPDEQQRIVHESLDRYYREQLDEPIPALGDISPRQAIKSAKGRKKVIAWLKRLENHVAAHKSPEPMADYDTAWLWQELGLKDLQK